MKKNKLYIFTALIIFLITLPFIGKTFGMTDNTITTQILNNADKEFEKHNYREALELYQKFLQSTKNEEAKKKTGLQILKTLKLLKDYDKLTEELEKYLKIYSNTVWQARAYHFGTGVYQEIPHEGYKRDDKIYRNTRHREGEYVNLYEEDFKKAFEYYNKAKQLYYSFKPSKTINEEHINLNFDFAEFLAIGYYHPLPVDIKEEINLNASQFNPDWKKNKQVTFLYEEIYRLNHLVLKENYSAKALLKKAVYIARVNGLGFDYSKDKNPFKDNPYTLLWDVVNKYPKTDSAPEALIGIARLHLARQENSKALEIFETFLKKYPKHKLASDAKAEIQDITKEELMVSVPGIQSSKSKPKANLSVKNLDTVNIKVYSIDLKKILMSTLNKPEKQFSYLQNIVGDKIAETRKHYREKVYEQQVKTGDKGNYIPFNKEIELQVLNPGSYIIETAGKTNTSLALLLISDITMIINGDSNQSYITLVDANNGKPVSNAQVVVKEHYYDNASRNVSKQGTTDLNGLYIYNKAAKGNNGSNTSVLAWKDNHLTFSNAHYYFNYHDQQNIRKAYTYTDRPVYRPGQTVNLKQIIRYSKQGNFEIIPGKNVLVTIHNPRGEKVFETSLKTNESGTVNTSFKLPEKAALGMYYINTVFSDSKETDPYIEMSEGRNFRVEEYKKPEYEVSVTSMEQQIRPGETVKAKINAAYYFGAPVAGANVKYKVLKSPYYQYYYPYREYDWYFPGRFPHPSGEQPGVVVKEGESLTDAEGNLTIEFQTDTTEQDYKYDVVAEVTDKSRRTINGQTSIKVAAKAFNAFINLDRGFYLPGENISIEINLRNPDNQPVKENGTLKIYEVTYSGPNREKEETKEVFSKAVESNADGRINLKWKAPKEGYYKIGFEALDKFEKKVESYSYVWVAGNNFSGRYYKFQNVEIITDKETYKEGEIARVMINTDFPDSYVMFYEETGNDVLNYKTLFIPSKSQVINIKITDKHIPNFNLKAGMVKNRQLFLANRELFVPPAKQFLNVEVNSGKETYLPGEEATVKLKVTDNNGKPVQAEVSVAVTDSSVFYIQGDLSGDIRQYYYGGRRYFQTHLESSLNYYMYQLREDSGKYENYRRHGGPFSFYGTGGRVQAEFMPLFSDGSVPPPAPTSLQSMAADTAMPQAKAMNREESQSVMPVPTPEMQQPEIRTDFADTAVWKPVLLTGKNGQAEIKFKMPDSLTTWNISSKAVDKFTRVGSDTSEFVTKKNLLVRLQAPRFFVEKDQVVISAIVNNYLPENKNVRAELSLSPELENTQAVTTNVTLNSNGEKRIDWTVNVKKSGLAKIMVKALTDQESDAMELTFPVLVHGIDKFVAQNGVMKTESRSDLALTIPAERRKGDTTLQLTLNSSVLSTISEALPYLASYPYGCIEQTTSRFIPTVLVSKTLKETGFNMADILKANNLNGTELSKFLYRKNNNPVYDNDELAKMVTTGLDRIYSFQNSDGGFGWWSGSSSDPYMSAYVLHGLILAREAGYNVRDNVYNNVVNFLTGKFSEKSLVNYNRLYIAYVLSMVKKIQPAHLEEFFKKRDDLNNYGKALLSLSYGHLAVKDKAELILQNLKSFVHINKENGTASWDNDTRWWWYWYGDRIETNAFILKAFVQNKPDDEVVPMLAKWILNNRKGNHWYSTKDTANAIYSLAEYARANNELNPDYSLSVLYNGELVKKVKVNRQNMLTFDNKIILTDRELGDGTGKISIIKEGNGTLYYSSFLEYFTLEENIKGSGNEIHITREYFKLTEKKGKDNRIAYGRTPIEQFAALKSGELVEVKLTIKADNNYEYLVFEDYKPAGFEATEVQSGYIYQNGISLNRELRDEKVAFFINRLQEGTQVITYKLRAEIPGDFHVLPHNGYAMYAPEVRAISDEMRIKVND